MAEIVDQLRLDISEALRQIDRVEASIDRALAPVEIEIEVDAQSTEELESTLREVERIAGRAATEVQSIALRAGDAEANFEDLARALGITEREARDLTTELLDAQAAGNRLEDAARDVARQLGLSDREAERLAGSLKEADRAAEAIDVTTIGLGTRFSNLRTTATLIAATLAGIGGTAVLAGAISGANAAIQSFARLEDSINAVNVVFGTAADTVLRIGENSAQAAGLSAEAFNQAVVPVGALLQNFGFDAKQAADAATILVQRGADLASVYGGSVQDALLAVGAALRGEADPLERYGASISSARVEQFALAEALVKTKAEITPSLTLQARYGLILSDTAAVANDFANTSDDLANAQRIAAASAADFGTELGEVLAPALEDLLVLVPGVLEGVRQLIPAFGAAGDSAASFFAALGEGGGFREEGAGLAAFFDVVSAGGGIAANVGGVIAGMGRDVLNLDASAASTTAALERFNAALEEPITKGIALTLATALDKGTDSATAFSRAIAQTAKSTTSFDSFEKSFRNFAIAANLSQAQLAGSTRSLLANREALGLTSPEVAFLTGHLNALNEELDTGGRANREFNAAARDTGDILEPIVTSMEDLAFAASDAGLSFVDLRTGTSEIAQDFRDILTPTQDLNLTFDALEEDVTIAAGLFQDSLRPSIIDATEAIQNFGTDGKLSLNEFIEGLGEAETAARNFRSNLLTILATEGGAELFETLRNLPADVAAQLAEEAVSTGRIEETAEALLGDSEALAAEFARIQRDALTIFRKEGPEAAELFILGSIALFEDEQIQDDLRAQLDAAVAASKTDVGNWIERVFAQDDALNRAAGFTADHYSQQVIDRFGLSTFASGEDIGDIVEAGFTQDDAAITAAGLTADAYEQAIIDRIGLAGFLSGADLGDTIAATFASDDALNGAIGAGIRVGDAFWDSVTQARPQSVRDITSSVSKTLSAGLKESSPSQIFVDAGTRASDAFWMGFDESDFIGTSFEQLESVLPAAIQRSVEAVNLAQFDALGIAMARQLTTAVEGDFRLSPELDPLTAEQLLALNLDPITPVIGPADPLTVGQLQEMVDAANAARTTVESQLEAIRFDFEFQGLQEDLAALTATTGEAGTAARQAFMAGLSATTSEEVVQLRASILDTINNATESNSPSRLMLRLGEDAGEAYWNGFDQADMSLRLPTPSFTGTVSGTDPTAVGSGNTEINFSLPNLETRDADTTIARAAQLMSSVAGILNGRFKL